MDERVVGRDDPRSAGKALTGPLSGLWRYRVGDFRMICDVLVEAGKVATIGVYIGLEDAAYFP